jgi:hypothetical protein
MKFWKAVLIGAIVWAIIFFEVSILMFGFKLTGGTLYYVIHYVFALIIAILAGLIYFKKRKGSFGEGLLFGIVMILVGAILDAAITIPLFIHSYAFFLDPMLLIGFAETLIVSSVVGILKK